MRNLLDQASQALNNRLEAELITARAMAADRGWLYAHADDRIEDPGKIQHFAELLARRMAGEPIAYLMGSREFYGRDFSVDASVLVPRPETELLVDLALSLPLPSRLCALDIGTGSGCIALTLAMERPHWQITATDLSTAALEVAGRNRLQLACSEVELLHSDLFSALSGRRFELIVSNPPYVAAADPHLQQADLSFEPAIALTPGEDGLSLLRQLIAAAGRHLHSQGWLLLEHGYDQAGEVRALLQAAGFASVASHKDLAGIERVSYGCWV